MPPNRPVLYHLCWCHRGGGWLGSVYGGGGGSDVGGVDGVGVGDVGSGGGGDDGELVVGGGR